MVRHFAFLPGSDVVAQAAECADDQGMFWEYEEALFENQASLSEEALAPLAAELGMDEAQFNSCIASGSKAARVQADVDAASDLGVRGTPTFFIDGQQYFQVFSVEEIRPLLDSAIESAGGATTPFRGR